MSFSRSLTTLGLASLPPPPTVRRGATSLPRPPAVFRPPPVVFADQPVLLGATFFSVFALAFGLAAGFLGAATGLAREAIFGMENLGREWREEGSLAPDVGSTLEQNHSALHAGPLSPARLSKVLHETPAAARRGVVVLPR